MFAPEDQDNRRAGARSLTRYQHGGWPGDYAVPPSAPAARQRSHSRSLVPSRPTTYLPTAAA